MDFAAGGALSEPGQSRHWGWAQGSCLLWIPKPEGHFSLFPFLFFSQCSLSRRDRLLAGVVRPSLPLKPQRLCLVRLVKMRRFSVESKGSSKDKRHWKEPPLPSSPAPSLLRVPRTQGHLFIPSLCCLPFPLHAVPANPGCSFLPHRVPGCPSPVCCLWPPRRSRQPNLTSLPVLARPNSVDQSERVVGGAAEVMKGFGKRRCKRLRGCCITAAQARCLRKFFYCHKSISAVKMWWGNRSRSMRVVQDLGEYSPLSFRSMDNPVLFLL